MHDYNSSNYTLNRLDYFTIKLTKMGEGDFVARVLSEYDINKYTLLPKHIADKIADILEAKAKALDAETTEEEGEETV